MSVELINKYIEPAISCFTFDNEQNQQCDLSELILSIIGSVALILAATYCLKKGIEIKERKFKKLKKEFKLASKDYRKTKDLAGLIQSGIPVDHRFKKGRTALHLAANHFNPWSAKELIRLKAKIDLEDDDGNTPLQLAAKNADKYSLRKLIKSGANTDIVDSEGNTLLHLVTMSNGGAKNKIQCFKFLAVSGVDTKAKNKLGKTPWEIAKESDWPKGWLNRVEEILDFKIPGLEQREFEKLRDEFYFTSENIHKAKDLKGIIQRGMPVNCRFYFDKYGETLNGQTALHIAARHYNPWGVKELIELNAEIDPPDDKGNTPLLFAAKRAGNISVQELIRSGANTHIVDSEGNTLLHLVAMSNGDAENKIECFKLLAVSGVDIKAKNHLGKTPWEIAKESDWPKGCLNRVEEILDYKIPGFEQREFEELRDEFYQASKEKRKDLEGIIQRGMPINYRFCGYGEYGKILNGQTALHIAARSFNSSGVQELIRLGANTEEKDDDGITPLQLAAKEVGSGVRTAPELIKLGADKDIVDSEENNLLHLAAMGCEHSKPESHIEFLKLLVKYGVDKEAKNNSRKTPWAMAQESNWAKYCLTEVEEILGSDFDLPID